MEDDRSYYARRAAEERSAADKCENARARDAHLRMAEHYEEQAETAQAAE